MMTHSPLDMARVLLAHPTAPFHEDRVRAALVGLLDGIGIGHETDRYGNLLAHYRRGGGPLWGLAAHMDHPGIEITRRRSGLVHGVFLGGVRPEALPGSPVALFGPRGEMGRGEIVEYKKSGSAKSVKIKPTGEFDSSVGFGTFHFGKPSITARQIRATALDDLIGCAAALSVLAHFKAHRMNGRVTAIFTRAEEVGFVGAQHLAASGRLPADMHILSLETSKAMPGAEAGGGPVIRVGDRTTLFDREIEYHMVQTARRIMKDDPHFRFQRQLMTGGTCEATAYALFGYRTMGLAFPLINYHNMGEDGGVLAEEIATGDYLLGIHLLIRTIADGRRMAGALARYHAALRRATTRYGKRLTPG